jgi:SAM-dependent methyltransferase
MNQEALQELAQQLRQPHGTHGIEVADMMNENNIQMTLHAIACLDIQASDVILELGHGNCKHLPIIFQQNDDISYYGLDISTLMHQEAQKINHDYIISNKAFFHLYEGVYIPFANNYFNKIFTVNTIYFWSQPETLLMELYRVTKPGGVLNITYAQEDFMKQLPFTQYGFTLYSNEKVQQLVATTPFSIIDFNTQRETVHTKTGEEVTRDFTTCILKKL